MKTKITDSELGEIYCESNILGRVKKFQIEGQSVVKNANGVCEYTAPDGKKVYFGIKSGIYKGIILNYNGRIIQLVPALRPFEIALAISGLVLLLLFCAISICFGILTINPVACLFYVLLIFAFTGLSGLPIMQNYFSMSMIIILSVIIATIIDVVVFAGCFLAYISIPRRIKRMPLKILAFILCYAVGVVILVSPYIIMRLSAMIL